MRNNIFVFSRDKFKKEVNQLSEQQFMATAFVSIHDPVEEIDNGNSDTILNTSVNVLNMWFHDAEEGIQYLLFNDWCAGELFRFIEKNKDKKQWIVHCTAGISRSGAVGEFLADYFGISYHLFKRDNPQVKPNTLVKNTLRKYI